MTTGPHSTGGTAVLADGRTIWVLDRLGERPLTINKVTKLHRQQWATYTRYERRQWLFIARQAQVPHLDRIRITAIPLHRDRRSPQDVAACAAAVKPAIDGLVDAGVLADDDATHLVEIAFRPPAICGRDGLRLVLEPVEEAA